MKIGIVGNRIGWTSEEVLKILRIFVLKHDKIISGGAEGVDTYAQMFAKEKGLEITIFYPKPQRPSPQRYYERNAEIVKECDMLMAFQKNPHRSGTQNSIKLAKKLGKRILVFPEYLNGE